MSERFRNSRRYTHNEVDRKTPDLPRPPAVPVEASSPTVFLQDPDVTLWHGDAIQTLQGMPAGSVDCVVTSPPYWGLRDYGTGAWEGGAPGCDHEGSERYYTEKTAAGSSSEAFSEAGEANAARLKKGRWREQGVCVKCGATRVDQQLGLEPTPDLYVEHMVAVFREVHRVLADHGTCWVNMGDSYAANRSYQVSDNKHKAHDFADSNAQNVPPGLKPKDLCMVPAKLALALQAPYYTGAIRNEVDRVWLAAIVDAEGCIYISRSKEGAQTGRGRKYQRTQDSFDIGIRITNTNRALLERVQEIVGHGKIRESAYNGRQAYDWNAYSSKARTLLAELYPHLVGKQGEARLAYRCPSSGEDARKAWQSLKDLHQGLTPCIDFQPPEGMWERGWFLRSDVIWAKLDRTRCRSR